MRLATWIGILLAWPEPLLAQTLRLDVVGSVYCKETATAPTIPAGNVRVQAERRIAFERPFTHTQIDNGFYRLPLRYQVALNSQVVLKYFASGKAVGEQTISVALGQLRDLSVPELIAPTLEVQINCDTITPTIFPEDASWAAAAGSGLSTRTIFLTAVAVSLGASGIVVATNDAVTSAPVEIQEIAIDSTITTPQLGFRSERALDFPYLGFRYAATRNESAAIAWNASNTAFKRGSEVSTRLSQKRRATLSGYVSSERGLATGFDYAFSEIDSGSVLYDKTKRLEGAFRTRENLFGAYVAKEVTKNIATSLGVSVLLQDIAVPSKIRREFYAPVAGVSPSKDFLERESSDEVSADASIGMSIRLSDQLLLGIALNGVLADPEMRNGVLTKDRVFGVGSSWSRGKTTLGIDTEYSKANGANASIGGQLEITPSILFNAGYLTINDSVRAGLSIRGVEYSVAVSRTAAPRHSISLTNTFFK